MLKKILFGQPHAQNLFYNKDQDFLVCPMRQQMPAVYTTRSKTSTSFLQHHTVYQVTNCQICPLRGQCFKAQGNRAIEINHKLQRLKLKAKENLESN